MASNKDNSQQNKSENTRADSSQAEKDLAKIREIINAQALLNEAQRRQDEAREYVSKVVTEALNDRQQKDASVSKTLMPIVEKSVQQSIKNHRKQFIDYLYPLVGDLVRKFGAAFFRDFFEKTNELIENSFSFKSIGWRYNAWRAGVGFSSYLAAQTYVFKIQQVLLIHKETGILLNGVSDNHQLDENSDLVSSMLTAISDFVSDSFTQSESTQQQNLDEIKTDNYTLYLHQGPNAILVAAVTGSISPSAKSKLQETLEHIHRIYLPQLQEFNGDTAQFAPVSVDLNECLLFEEKNSENQSKTPWRAIILFSTLVGLLGYWFFLNWQTTQALERIQSLDNKQGIVINNAEIRGIKDIHLTLLRDPNTISVEQWLEASQVDAHWIQFNEIGFQSYSAKVAAFQLSELVKNYPNVAYDTQNNTLSGTIGSFENISLQSELSQINGIELLSPSVDVELTPNTTENNQAINKAIQIISGEISLLQIDFGLASSAVSQSQIGKLQLIASRYKELVELAQLLELDAKLIILGASDNIGDNRVNQILSIERAQNTAKALISLGLNKDQLMTSGLGIVKDTPPDTNIRKAIIHVIYNTKKAS